MFRLRYELNKIKLDRIIYEDKFNEGNELLEVKENLNNRVVNLREQLLNDPENKNLNFELGFCLEEIERIEKELESYNEKYETTEGKINKYEQLIEMNLKELYSYIDLLSNIDVDKKLIEDMEESLKSLDTHISYLQYLNKKNEDDK